jgi:nucleotide-binding universal stress UspA family protein
VTPVLTGRRPHAAGVEPAATAPGEARPVVVATLEAPLIHEAARVGVDSAVEAGQPLLVVNAVESLLAPCGLVLGYDYVAPPDVEESLRTPAVLAHSLGVRVERFCLRSPRPVDALLDLVVERGCGLLVVGPDRTRIGRWRYRRAVRKIRDGAPCLLWLAHD